MSLKTGEHLDFVPPHEEKPGPGYEVSDLNMKGIVNFAIGFAIFILAAHVLMVVMFFVLRNREPAPITPHSPPVVQVQTPIMGPQLEVSPSANWDAMRSAQAQVLSGYGWVSPQTGTVRIPIERAMNLALERGLFKSAATQPAQAR